MKPSDKQSLSDDEGASLSNFELGKQVLCHSDCSQYQAVFVNNKVIFLLTASAIIPTKIVLYFMIILTVLFLLTA